jgi:hypothetical protein
MAGYHTREELEGQVDYLQKLCAAEQSRNKILESKLQRAQQRSSYESLELPKEPPLPPETECYTPRVCICACHRHKQNRDCCRGYHCIRCHETHVKMSQHCST